MRKIITFFTLLIKLLTSTNDDQVEPETYQVSVVEAVNAEDVSRGKEEHIIIIPKYDIPMPLEHQVFAFLKCEELGVEYELVLGIIELESSFDASLVCSNSNGSVDRGYLQINSCREKELKKQGYTDLLDPYQNLEIGINIIADLLNRYEDEVVALESYNKGERGYKENYADKGIYQTAYSQRVIEYKNNFKGSD